MIRTHCPQRHSARLSLHTPRASSAPARSLWLLLAASAGASACLLPMLPSIAAAEALSPDDAAMNLLNGARKAFNEKNYPYAAERFKEFLGSNSGHREAPSAYYGLGLSLLEQPQKDDAKYAAAVDALQKAAANTSFSDRPMALYYLGVALRGQGQIAANKPAGNANEAAAQRQAANAKFEEAAKQFAAAQQAFKDRVKEALPATATELPADLEWSARARCDTAEMLLRVGKFKEALEAISPFQSDAILAKSRYKPLALYHLGYAQFGLKDYTSAGRALSQLAPFQQDFGGHARYLLARVHHLSDERPEAAANYQAVIDGYEPQKKAAQQALQNPAQLDAERRAALEALVKGPTPDYVIRARFYAAVLQSEDGHYPEAAEKFTAIIQQDPKSPLVPEAQLRLGFCKLQSKSYPDAVKLLDKLKDDPQYGDRALWWTARAQVGAADATKPEAVEQAAKNAIDTLRKAAEKANALAATDPQAKARRGDILMEIGDTQQLARQYAEAAATYAQVLAENAASDRAEEATERRVTALHLAKQYKESDALAAQFEQKYPRSTLLPSVWFRSAENAYLTALAAAKAAGTQKDSPELTKQFDVAVARYQKLIDKYPEFENVDLARQAMATAQYRLGRYDEAIKLLLKIPETSRTGELATVPYLQADCLIRTMPAEADDALTAERLIETATDASKLLESFVQGQPKSPSAPDAMLKLGHCYQSIGAQVAIADEKLKALTKAKEVYEKCLQQFPNDPAMPSVVFERARVLALMGNVDGAVNDLRRFQSDPLKKSPNAPLALVRLSALLRTQNKADAAVEVMKQCRAEYQTALSAEPARADWVPLIQYEQGVALKEAKKLPEAREVFEQLAKQFAARPEGQNAVWRIAQCRREALSAGLDAAQKLAAKPGVKPEEVAAAYDKLAPAAKEVIAAAETMRQQADALGAKAVGSEPYLRMLYESAWCNRIAADVESDAARQKARQAAVDKARQGVGKQLNTQNPPALAPPDVASADLPMSAGEKKARDAYRKLIDAAPAAALSVQARYELAELCANRKEYDVALDLLASALENGATADMAERVKLRVAACLLAKNDPISALVQCRAVSRNEKSTLAPEARYLAGECFLRQQDWQAAIDALKGFRDIDALKNLPNLTDRALLRLGAACAGAGQWDQSRQALQTLVDRFGQSPWYDEAKFNIGLAYQNQKQYDQAISTYAEVTRRTAAECAAKAQLNTGLCKLEQKKADEAVKALLAVPYTYDYPEWSAAAWYHAARAYDEAKQPDEAAKCRARLVQDYPNSSWAKMK